MRPLENAMESQELLLSTRLKGEIAIFLDYDGTLTPIVNDPEKAVISRESREVLLQLSNEFPTAVVSGRSCDKLRSFLNMDDLVIAGSHGLDIRMPGADKRSMLHPIGESAHIALKRAQHQLNDRLRDLPGYLTEDNILCVSAHYRMVPPERQAEVHKAVQAVLDSEPSLKHKEGKMVHELRPAVDWDKGQAVKWLLSAFCARCADENLVPLYIGDDVADEDAFKFAEANGGVGIKVADSTVTEADTAASLQIKQDEVIPFLSLLVNATSPR